MNIKDLVERIEAIADEHGEVTDNSAGVFLMNDNTEPYFVGEGDPYDILQLTEAGMALAVHGHFGLICYGWATPIGGSVFERRRVRLVTVVNTYKEMGSVVRFMDTNESEFECGESSGALKDAMMELAERVVG